MRTLLLALLLLGACDKRSPKPYAQSTSPQVLCTELAFSVCRGARLSVTISAEHRADEACLLYWLTRTCSEVPPPGARSPAADRLEGAALPEALAVPKASWAGESL